LLSNQSKIRVWESTRSNSSSLPDRSARWCKPG